MTHMQVTMPTNFRQNVIYLGMLRTSEQSSVPIYRALSERRYFDVDYKRYTIVCGCYSSEVAINAGFDYHSITNRVEWGLGRGEGGEYVSIKTHNESSR
jgi:hypothetical protein